MISAMPLKRPTLLLSSKPSSLVATSATSSLQEPTNVTHQLNQSISGITNVIVDTWALSARIESWIDHHPVSFSSQLSPPSSFSLISLACWAMPLLLRKIFAPLLSISPVGSRSFCVYIRSLLPCRYYSK